MVKPENRGLSRYAREAVELLGMEIRNARIEQKLTIAELAERAGVSRGLVQRAERGDSGCSVGAVFELAAIVGLRLFDPDPATLPRYLSVARDKMMLLPKSARRQKAKVFDDF